MSRAVIILLGFSLLIACEEQTVKTSPDSAGSPTGQSGSKKTAGVGDSIELNGLDDGSKVRMTVLKIVDPAGPANEFSKPETGKRFVAVQIRVTNIGSVVYEDTPANGAKVIDSEDQQYDTNYGDTAAGPSLSSATIRPGDTRVGYITFEVPAGAKIRAFQLALDSGFGPETGEWTIS